MKGAIMEGFRKIILEPERHEAVLFEEIDEERPIFAEKDEEPIGMVVDEPGKRWIVRTGGNTGATGHHQTLRECLVSCCVKLGYEFFQK
jgi:hypothetical protein